MTRHLRHLRSFCDPTPVKHFDCLGPGTWTIGSAAVTREALHPLGGNAPNQKGYNANRWGRAPIDNKYKCGLAARNNDLDSNASRTRAACSARGRGCPDSEQQAHVRMRRPHPRHAKHKPQQHDTSFNPKIMTPVSFSLSTRRCSCSAHGYACPRKPSLVRCITSCNL